MSFIRTVLGDIEPAELGVCYAHEHVIIDPGYVTQMYPEFCLDSVEKGAAELTAFREAGGRAMVDSMPCAAGRNVLKLAEISRRSGVHLLCPTGYHLKQYYHEGHWGTRQSAEQLAALFVADIEEGIDANDYAGPTCERTPHRAGLIKVAGGLDRLDAHEARLFEAAALAHRRTGAPILTHTEQGTAGMEQIALLQRHGADLSHVVLSHTDRKPDYGYHAELLSTGVNLEYDSAFRWQAEQGNPTRDLVAAMVEKGFGGQILLGMDAARTSYWRSYGGKPGMTYLLETFVPMLREAGLAQVDVDRIFISNPAAAYAFAVGT